MVVPSKSPVVGLASMLKLPLNAQKLPLLTIPNGGVLVVTTCPNILNRLKPSE